MITPTEHQFAAIKKVAQWYKDAAPDLDGVASVSCLGGYAGSGKTTILPHILEQCGLHPEDVAFVAPTGKAAKVMSSKLKDFGITTPAKTIHSSIYLPKSLKADVLEQRLKNINLILSDARVKRLSSEDVVFFDGQATTHKHLLEILKVTKHDLDKAYTVSEGPKFTFNIESKIYNKSLIIVDESSMVGEEVVKDLKSFGVPILAIGDPGQLPPVGDNPGFNIASPDVFLTEIHRQAKDNPIIWLATLAREGKLLPYGTHGDSVCVIKRSQDDVSYDPDRNVQVIVGTNANRWRVTDKIRAALGYDSDAPMKGERLICCRNSRQSLNLVNGAMVEVLEAPEELVEGSPSLVLKYLDEEDQIKTSVVYQGLFEEHKGKKRDHFSADKRDSFKARKNDEHFDWAWAITCHKSQGSQWDDVCVHDESGAFRENAAKWLYTAITRASKFLTVVG
jgi:exodeoxyribonuclease V